MDVMKRIYLDYAATTPLDSRVRRAMEPYFSEQFGNPGSIHTFGQEAMAAVDRARETVAKAIGADFREIIFTGSATEANNLAIKGVLSAYRKKGKAIITSVIEHFSVAHPIKTFEKEGGNVTWISVDSKGRGDPKWVGAAIRNDTVLISIMHANNEIGTLQPIAEIGRIVADAAREPQPKRA